MLAALISFPSRVAGCFSSVARIAVNLPNIIILANITNLPDIIILSTIILANITNLPNIIILSTITLVNITIGDTNLASIIILVLVNNIMMSIRYRSSVASIATIL